MHGFLRDPDEHGKYSASRLPLVVWFVLVTVLATVFGAMLLWTHFECAGAHPPDYTCTVITYDEFGPYLDRILNAFWAFGAIYGVGKVGGKIKDMGGPDGGS